MFDKIGRRSFINQNQYSNAQIFYANNTTKKYPSFYHSAEELQIRHFPVYVAVLLQIKSQTSPLQHMWFMHMPAIVDCVLYCIVLNATINEPRGESCARFVKQQQNRYGLAPCGTPVFTPFPSLYMTLVSTVSVVIKGRCATITLSRTCSFVPLFAWCTLFVYLYFHRSI